MAGDCRFRDRGDGLPLTFGVVLWLAFFVGCPTQDGVKQANERLEKIEKSIKELREAIRDVKDSQSATSND
jgi:septal ring factor EnvC (AmiA/AmiB activator)